MFIDDATKSHCQVLSSITFRKLLKNSLPMRHVESNLLSQLADRRAIHVYGKVGLKETGQIANSYHKNGGIMTK